MYYMCDTTTAGARSQHALKEDDPRLRETNTLRSLNKEKVQQYTTAVSAGINPMIVVRSARQVVLLQVEVS